jgi:ADP-heptose:LPS heptosyltransferase
LQPNEYVVIHCGARDPARRWAPAKFAAVADALAEGGLRVLLTGVESERPQVEEVAARMNAASEVVCGRTTLGGMACLLEHSRLLVANDTGVSHIAAALGTSSVIVFTHSEPERWAAPDATRHRRFIEPTALTNSCCHQDAVHRCLADGCRFLPEREGPPVEVASVIEAALELSLDRTPDVAPI